MTIVKELNDLAEKMTGTNPNKKTIAKVLDYIEQNYTAGGGSGSGGSSAESDIFIVNGSTSDGQNYTIDKTYQEISEAYSQNKLLLLSTQSFKVFLNYTYDETSSSFVFNGKDLLVYENSLIVLSMQITSDDALTLTNLAYTLTPAN